MLTEAAFWKIWLSKYFMWYEAKSAQYKYLHIQRSVLFKNSVIC